ncbi:crotonobetaine/carnitine-CoA ligase [Scopulibacillus darangshiensis]|uniref:Crotonobetaine/carnitine-CoA ligase n=1 Tax=Scopulibacillus darangshiensis TaxID=442528 RepID=A0A4V2SKS4_9BACL|nr:AMP-binding protein [Scopulibacillus darangshiensis]TCP20656.1 crotonobetaine/carnitine-CoA ligase [Scopulibacillus darangshiensis]
MTSLPNQVNHDLSKLPDIRTLVSRAASLWGDRTALIFDEWDKKLTYTDLHVQSDDITKALLNLGVKKGDKVGVMMNNRPEFPLSWLAICKAGAIMVPININYQEYDLAFILENAEVKLVLGSSEFASLFQNVQKAKPFLNTRFIAIDDDESKIESINHFIMSRGDALPTVFSETVANIQYTSGTTGKPKGCILTHGYWLRIAEKNILSAAGPQICKDDIMLTAQPFYYMDPQWNLITAIASGAALIVLDRFHPSSFWAKIREYDVTFFYCLGAMPALMLKMPPKPLDRQNNVRYIGCSAIPANLHKELEERWRTPWYEAFGMTETGLDIRMPRDEHDQLVGKGCMGLPIDDREVRIMNDKLEDVPRGKTGELALRGAMMMTGYYKNPDVNKKAFHNGFFLTGDLAYMDKLGYVYYVGRKKEMIRRSGENISAMEVEEVLKQHPCVHNSAVIPVIDELRGEEVKAYLVLKEGNQDETISVHTLIDFCKRKLAYFKVPRYWEYRKALPLTSSERVAKHQLIKEKDDLRKGAYDRVDDIWR